MGWREVTLNKALKLSYGKSPKEIQSSTGFYPIYGTGGLVGKGNDYLNDGESVIVGRKGTINNVAQKSDTFPKLWCQKSGRTSGNLAIDSKIPANGITHTIPIFSMLPSKWTPPEWSPPAAKQNIGIR